MERVEDCISFLIGKAGQAISRRARQKLAPFDVTPVQYAVLKVLWNRDGQSGVEIGTRLVIDSATMTGVIERLHAAELIERRADNDDRRIQRIHLTPKGAALEAPLDRAMDELNEEARLLLGGQADTFWRGLRTLTDGPAQG